MIQDLNDSLVGIAIGIRFRANFSIEDKLGEIVDKILYNKNSYFNPSVFPTVYNNVNEKTLINEITNDHMLINNSNIILEINFGPKFKLADQDEILKRFDDEIIQGIVKDFKISQINRLGLIKRYLFNDKSLGESFIKKTIGQNLDGVKDINLRFSKKFPVPESMVKKDIYDWHNAIFNVIKKSDQEELFMSIDYQKYFEPFLPSAHEVKFSLFSNQVQGYNKGKYLDWVNSNYSQDK